MALGSNSDRSGSNIFGLNSNREDVIFSDEGSNDSLNER